MPPVMFDSHLHVIDPRFPLVATSGFTPTPFTVADYRARTAGLPIAGGAVVSGSFQGADQTYLLDALRRLGPRFVGVTQMPPDVDDASTRAPRPFADADVTLLREALGDDAEAALYANAVAFYRPREP